MITLYHFGPFQGLSDPSPFCLKVDCYLRACGLEFKTEAGVKFVGESPKHKLPYIVDDGKAIGDSNFIIDYLKDKHGDSLDAGLSPEQKAVSRAFIKMMDENLYWCIVQSRWLGELWPDIKQEFFGNMPQPLKTLVPAMARRSVKKTLFLQGLGRHSEQELLEIAQKDIQALSDYLGNKQYFLSDKPTTLDVTAFAFLAEMIVPQMNCKLNDVARSFDNLVKFTSRLQKEYYSM
ncbi:MAG: glutathione S-transferase family protein [Gammaproteobacteria bacterium]|nr:glutathione S-transferase family protein [Gammaproteobacteria bacterium]